MHIPANVTRAFGKIAVQAQKHAPTILTIVGVTAGVAATGFAIHATLKCDEVLEGHKEKMKAIERARYIADNDPDFEGSYTEEQMKMDRRVATVQTVCGFAKLYWPTIALTTVSVTSILFGHHLMSKRNAAVVAAFTAMSGKFDDYRKAIVDKYGNEVDSEVFKRILTEAKVNEEGEVVEVKEQAEPTDNKVSLDRFYDELSLYWDHYNPEMNVAHLRSVLKHAQDKLDYRGYVFLNDIYDDLGMTRTPAGCVLGWIVDEDHPDTVVDLGVLKDTDDPWDFVIDEPWDGRNGLLITPNNVQVIYDKI